MAKETNIKLTEDVELILKKINDIMRNQLIIDVMLLIQGINFLIHPEKAHKGIIESLALAVFFAATGIVTGLLIAHGSIKRHNLRPIMLAIIFIVLSIIVYLNAGHLAPAFHYFIAFTIIFSGFVNILSAYHLIKLNTAKKSLNSKITSDRHGNKTVEGVTATLKNTTKLEAERILSPAVFFSGKVAKFRYGQLFINLLLIAVGVSMVFFRFRTNAVLLRISGGILIFSALSDFVALLWTHRESTFVHTITHYNVQSKPKQ